MWKVSEALNWERLENPELVLWNIILFDSLQVIYPFESEIDCDYKIKGSNLEMVTCFHHQAMIPFTHNGSIKAGAMTNIRYK